MCRGWPVTTELLTQQDTFKLVFCLETSNVSRFTAIGVDKALFFRRLY
jgi:hypothetical protein